MSILMVVIAPFLYIWRNLVQRVDKLEEDVQRKMDREDVRQLLADKLDPIEKNTEETKQLLYNLLAMKLKDGK